MAGLVRLARLAALAPACLLLLSSANAEAQASASDKAAAEALFDQGVRLMKQSSFAEACPKLEESNRVDPAVGTLLYLGECYERVGKTASAWATFREAASLANNSNQADRARIASGRAQQLEPKLSRLAIELAPEVSKLPGVLVKRGSHRLEPSLYGTPLPIDPGDYRIEVSAPGYETWSTPVTVAAGGASASVRVPGLVKAPEAATPAETEAAPPAAAAAPAASASLEPPPPATSGGISTQQTLGLVVGGVGIIGVGLGGYFGVQAISKNSDAEQFCTKDLCSDRKGLTLTEDAKEAAGVSNIALIAGGVLVATGAVLYLTGGKSETERVSLVPLLTPQSASASLLGRF